ncbi:hypothetical protein N0V82_010127 [Gnomoniopsis sp. IMI 355080]|nr:hypothetical protein N0V82_010127 [Gnomoniopsis sp. IMI 355080]
MTTAFKYAPLPTETSIRLLRIHRVRNGVLPGLCAYPQIHCSLYVVDLSLEGVPAYEALSYTWDSPETENQKRGNDNWKDPYGPLGIWPIVIRNFATGEQCLAYVRKNLFDALVHLQSLRSVDGKLDQFSKTILHNAAEDGDVDAVRSVLEEGASCGARDIFGETPLHYAAENGHYEVVKLLVAAGADMSIYDKAGRLPVQCCVQRKRGDWEKTARFLRETEFRRKELRSVKRGDLNLEARSTPLLKTPLIQASEDGDLARVQKLIRRGANLSAQAKFGKTGLHHAAGNGHYDIVKELVRAGADLNILDVEKRTPLVCCQQMKKGQWEVIARFLQDRTFRQEELSHLASIGPGESDADLGGVASGLFWIDAICINQADLRERSAQVRIMPQIYSRADCVIVWLGDDSQMLFRLLRNVWVGPDLKDIISRVNRKAKKLKKLEKQSHLGFFRGSSLWKMDKGWTMQDGKGGDGSEAWRLAEIRLRTTNDSDEWDIIDPILHTEHCKTPHVRRAERLCLPLLIAATWSFESKDPRDKIYAILSLAAPLPPEDQIAIDYTSPIEGLYTQVAHIFLRGSGRDSMYVRENALAGILEPLEGLSFVQDPYYSGQQAKMPGLPTWAPDFSVPLTTDRIWRRAFGAAKALEPDFGPEDRREMLYVLGLEVDIVDMVEPGWADLDPDDMPPDLEVDIGLSRWFSHGGQVADDDSKSMNPRSMDEECTPSTPTEDKNDKGDTKIRVEGLKSSLSNTLNHQRSLESATGSHKQRFLPSDDEIPPQEKLTSTWDWCKYHGDPGACKTLDNEASFRFQMVRVYRKRCLFRTKAGRLGLGPQSVKPGDTIHLLAGARTPYILRRRDGVDKMIDSFRFLGEAYVHGIMYGELASGLTKDGFTRIRLE